MLLSLRSSYAYFLIRELPHDLYYQMWMYVMCAVATSNQITIVPIHSIMCIACVSVRMCVCDSLLVASQNHTQILYTTCYLLHKMHLYIYTHRMGNEERIQRIETGAVECQSELTLVILLLFLSLCIANVQ